MTEDELLIGLTDALTIGGWTWTHSRRSDKAITMGHPGVMDLIAVHEGRQMMLAWELKDATGQPTYGQVAWLRGTAAVRSIDARVVRPADYDAALSTILSARLPALRCVICGRRADDLRVLDAAIDAGVCVDHGI